MRDTERTVLEEIRDEQRRIRRTLELLIAEVAALAAGRAARSQAACLRELGHAALAGADSLEPVNGGPPP